MSGPVLIGLGCTAGVGKDTVADLLVERYGFVKVAFADPIRGIALDLNPLATATVHLATVVEADGWTRAKANYPKVRRALNTVGVSCRKHLGADVFVDAAARRVEALMGKGRSVVMSDVRQINELDFVEGRGGVSVCVVRPGSVPANPEVEQLKRSHFMRDLDNSGSLADLAGRVDELVAAVTPEPDPTLWTPAGGV